MDETKNNWNPTAELLKLEKHFVFAYKQRNLDFKTEPLFPDWWQILLESTRSRLFDPYIATNISETMMASSQRDISLLGHAILTQIALLHPHVVRPSEVIKLPLIDPRIMADFLANDNRNYRNYANSRLLLLAIAKPCIDSIKYTIEMNFLEPYVDPRYREVYDALLCRDSFLLEQSIAKLLSNPDHRLFYYWWEIFSDRHLFAHTA